jgi:predicted nucleic acid-binding protein
LTGLRAFLRRHRRIALDTSIFIYELQANPRYVRLADEVFKWIEQPEHGGVTSTITMVELLVQPYRDSDEERVNGIYALLSTYPNLQWIAPDLQTSDIAAQFRASHGLRTADALQAATAARSNVTGLITNDPVFARIDAFETLLFDKLLDDESKPGSKPT